MFREPLLTERLGSALQQRGRAAIAGFMRFDRLFQSFVADLQPSHVAEWDALIVAYEADPSLPDPYFWKPTGTPFSAVYRCMLTSPCRHE